MKILNILGGPFTYPQVRADLTGSLSSLCPGQTYDVTFRYAGIAYAPGASLVASILDGSGNELTSQSIRFAQGAADDQGNAPNTPASVTVTFHAASPTGVVKFLYQGVSGTLATITADNVSIAISD